MSQDIRNDVGSLLLRLTIRELFDWRFMQTDPNWGNFLYDEHSDQLHLIDFGAAKEYPKPFVDDYLRMVLACADKNREELIQRSTKLKFLTGQQGIAVLHCCLLRFVHFWVATAHIFIFWCIALPGDASQTGKLFKSSLTGAHSPSVLVLPCEALVL